MCGGKESLNPAWAGFICYTLAACLVFGCHGALEILARPCDGGGDSEVFFMASGMGLTVDSL